MRLERNIQKRQICRDYKPFFLLMCLRLPDERIVATENFFCGSESENEIFIYGGQYCIQISSKEEFASMAKRAFTTGCMKMV